MFNPRFYDGDDPVAMYNMLQQQRGAAGRPPKKFDEYYRCYPTAMLPGAERDNVNYGGKIILPSSALEKLTRLHITYPMLFELFNGQAEKLTHAGVLEFIAEEGKVYLPYWMMQTLLLDTGDLVQIKSTDLQPARLVKLQPQSVLFLDISDPKAVLEKAFRDFSTLTKGDIFSFSYNDNVYDVAVLEVKPESERMGVSMLETDVEVDFAPPIGYVDPASTRNSGTSTPRSIAGGAPGAPNGGLLHNTGTMAQAINYDAISPSATSAAAGARALSSHFLSGGQKLNTRKGNKGSSAPTPKPSTPVPTSSGVALPPPVIRRTNGPQPLRLPPNKLFFGYEIKPVKSQADKDKENAGALQPQFLGQGQTLRGGVKRRGEGDGSGEEEISIKGKGKANTGTGVAGKRVDGKAI